MSDMRYLKKFDQTWSVQVEIPRHLRSYFLSKNGKPKARFTKSLKTHSLVEARELRWKYVADFKEKIALARQAYEDDPDGTQAEAMKWREMLNQATNKAVSIEEDLQTGTIVKVTEREFILDEIRDVASEMDMYGDSEGAEQFLKLATTDTVTVKGEMNRWKAENKPAYQNRTFSMFEEVFDKFLDWASDGILVSDVDRKIAGNFISEILLKETKTNGESLADATLNRKKSHLMTLWSWMVSRGVAEYNPWEKQVIRTGRAKKKTVREAWPEEDLKKLLTVPAKSRLWKQEIWDIPRLLLMLGARLDEVCSIRIEHIKEEAEGQLSVFLNGEKTDAAARWVPVHDTIVPIFQRRMKEDREWLFPKCEPSGPDNDRSVNVGKALRYHYRTTLGVTKRNQDNHALRTTFMEYLEAAGVSKDDVKLVVGHKREDITYGVYSKGRLVDLRERVIDCLDYGEVVMGLIKINPVRHD